MLNKTPYQMLGAEGIRELLNAFYDAMDELPQAETLRLMHAKNKDKIKEKLNDYLVGWLGGPPIYHEKYGTVCLTDSHKPYQIGPDERDQWLGCMTEALERVGASDKLKAMLEEPLARLTEAVRNSESSVPVEPRPNSIPLVNL
ncbi:MAG: group II truncated hemoglobin [Pseudomonadales bacterium]|nr:group II truncated hemoglobin [Pseudomonadales bacterium]